MTKSIKPKQLLSLGLLLFTAISIAAIVLNIKTIQNWLSRASGEPADIHIDVSVDAGPLDPVWQNLAQGGEDKNWRIEPIKNKVASLKPKYIRLDHIYDFYDPVKREGERLVFDWTLLDQIIRDIRSVNALPYISLSYMPAILGNGDITGKPNNWEEYRQVIQATVEHISGSNGLNLSNVYYEVWNEPDLFGGWKTYGDKNYLNLYHYAVRGAQQARNTRPFKIGGPATTALYDNWVNKFFEYATGNNLRVDFYSWHKYSYDVDAYQKDVQNFKNLIKNYPKYFNVETHITEWGPNSENDPVYDGSLSAAHLVAVSAQIYPLINKAFTFEIQDGKSPTGVANWGRWGLLTHPDYGSGIKPRYQALLMLNRLGSQHLTLTGQGGWVKALAARAPDRTIQTLVANYDPKSSHTENVPITFDNITPGSYAVTQEFLNQGKKSTTLATDSATLKYHLLMPPNSVALIELKPTF